jgi:hypothetical protein
MHKLCELEYGVEDVELAGAVKFVGWTVVWFRESDIASGRCEEAG